MICGKQPEASRSSQKKQGAARNSRLTNMIRSIDRSSACAFAHYRRHFALPTTSLQDLQADACAKVKHSQKAVLHSVSVLAIASRQTVCHLPDRTLSFYSTKDESKRGQWVRGRVVGLGFVCGRLSQQQQNI